MLYSVPCIKTVCIELSQAIHQHVSTFHNHGLCLVVSVFLFFCFVCLRPVSCVPNVTSISLHCPFLITPSVYVTVYLNIFYCSLLIANGYDKCFFLIFETSFPAMCFLIIFLVSSFAVFIY